jgi:S-adenosylmethionine hydrolase
VVGRAGGSVFLLTDYGLADEFAGVVRAAVSRHAPGVAVIDLTHDVPPFDVRAGALALVRAAPHLGSGVVMAVVDPGVGTARRAVAMTVHRSDARDRPRHFVGPDNGLLVWAVELLGGVERVVEIRRSARSSEETTTFDGRDVFAPAAARLWQGASLDALGPELDPGGLVRLGEPRVVVGHGALEVEVLWIDRFGNVQLAADPRDAAAAGLGDDLEVRAAVECPLRRVSTFAALAPGELGLIVDANRHLAVVCDRRSAATVLGVQPGDVVTLRAVTPGRAP